MECEGRSPGQFCSRFARQSSQCYRHAKPCGREITPNAGSRNAACCATAGEEIGHRRSIRAPYTRILVDDETALRVKQRPGHLRGKVWAFAVQRRIHREVAPERILPLG